MGTSAESGPDQRSRERDGSTPAPPPLPAAIRAAAVVVAVQALALAGIAVVVLVKTIFGHPDSVARALTETGLALFGAVVLALGARGLMHVRPSARSPVVVIELLALPVSYSLGIQAGLVAYGGPILITALAVLYLLFTPSARDALNRPG